MLSRLGAQRFENAVKWRGVEVWTIWWGVGRDGWVVWGPESPKTRRNDVLSRCGQCGGVLGGTVGLSRRLKVQKRGEMARCRGMDDMVGCWDTAASKAPAKATEGAKKTSNADGEKKEGPKRNILRVISSQVHLIRVSQTALSTISLNASLL